MAYRGDFKNIKKLLFGKIGHLAAAFGILVRFAKYDCSRQAFHILASIFGSWYMFALLVLQPGPLSI